MIIAIIMLNLLSVFILIFPFILIFKDYKIKKDIAKWLRDAVVIKAYSKKTGEKECLFLPKGIIIQVAFEFNNKTHVKDSDIKVFGGNKAYLASFKKYADKMINIAYSPQYDEVMILKDDGGGM